MIGCEVYVNFYILVEVDKCYYQDDMLVLIWEEIVVVMQMYIDCQDVFYFKFWYVVCYMFGLFQGQFGG